jgi:CRP-like cAMP-binding protein
MQDYVSHSRVAEIACFKGLPAEFVEALIRELDVQMFSEGDIIIKEGTPGSSMAFLLRGSVDVLKSSLKIGTLGEGSLIGEIACLGVSSKRTCTVVAKEFCDCRFIGTLQLKALLNRYPEAKARFQNIAEERNAETERMVKAVERLARRRRAVSSSPRLPCGGKHLQHSGADTVAEFSVAEVLSPARAPSGKPGSMFRKGRLLKRENSISSEETCATSSSSRPTSNDSSSTTKSMGSAEATLLGECQNARAASVPRCSQKATLPVLSPSNDGPQTLQAAMRAKNDVLRSQLQKTRAELISTCMSTKAIQIDGSRCFSSGQV